MAMKVFGATPVFRVTDLDAALKFYRDVLGFEVDFQYEDYAGLSLDHAGLHLTRAVSGKPSGAGAAYVFCEEIDEYFGTIRARGATPEREPADQIYAMRDFSLCDPDGNRLTFGCSIAKGEQGKG
jgi:catechol 2,3-dioxygenase-like lactoylglutathione lyase family enzyme